MGKAQYSTLVMALLSFVVAVPAQGFFRIAQGQDEAALLRPDGTVMALRVRGNVQLVKPGGLVADLSPAAVDQRAAVRIGELKRRGFNALGGGSDAELWHRGLPYIESLALSRQLAAAQENDVVDVYAPDFAEQVKDLILVAVRPRLQDRMLIGYLSDESLAWGPNRDPARLLASYLAQPWTGDDSGRQHAVDYLRQRYRDNIAALRKAWGTGASDFTTVQAPRRPNGIFANDAAGFAVQVLARYLSVVAAAVRSEDPNHLFLGTRLRVAPAHSLGTVWAIADAAVIDLAPGQDANAAVHTVETMTHRAILVAFASCGAAKRVPLPQVVGYSCGGAGGVIF